MRAPVKTYSLFIGQWLIAFIVCMIVHIPYFLGDHLSFDGDEAIVGIMAQDLLAGKNIPVYFYGQQYGFCFFEVISSAIGILFFGNTVWALKFGAVLIYSLGLAFLMRIFIHHKVSLFFTILSLIVLSTFPAWMVWAAKARGGYVTAFAAVCVITWVITTKPSNLKWIIISACMLSIGLHSQVLISISIFFAWGIWLIKSGSLKLILISILVLIASYILLKIPAYHNTPMWKAPVSSFYHFSLFGKMLYDSGKASLGYYYYEMTFRPSFFSWVFGIGFYIGCGILTVLGFLRIKIVERKYLLVTGFAVLTCFIAVMWMRIPSYRYLLGAFTASQLILCFALLNQSKKRLGKLAVLPLVVFGLLFSVTVRHIPDSWMKPEANDMKLYNGLLDELKRRGISNVYSTDALLQWQLNYSGVNARYTSGIERIQRFTDEVEKCESVPSCKTAIVGFTGFYNYMDDSQAWYDHLSIINEKYFIYESPDSVTLAKGGYEYIP